MNSAVAAEFKNGVIVLSFHVKKKFTKWVQHKKIRNERSPNRSVTRWNKEFFLVISRLTTTADGR